MKLKVILEFVEGKIYIGEPEMFDLLHEIQNKQEKLKYANGSSALTDIPKEKLKEIDKLEKLYKEISGKIYRTANNDESALEVLEALTNKSMALLNINTGNEVRTALMLKIIESNKIKWYCNYNEYWFRPSPIYCKYILKKKIQEMKRTIKYNISQIPF